MENKAIVEIIELFMSSCYTKEGKVMIDKIGLFNEIEDKFNVSLTESEMGQIVENRSVLFDFD